VRQELQTVKSASNLHCVLTFTENHFRKLRVISINLVLPIGNSRISAFSALVKVGRRYTLSTFWRMYVRFALEHTTEVHYGNWRRGFPLLVLGHERSHPGHQPLHRNLLHLLLFNIHFFPKTFVNLRIHFPPLSDFQPKSD